MLTSVSIEERVSSLSAVESADVYSSSDGELQYLKIHIEVKKSVNKPLSRIEVFFNEVLPSDRLFSIYREGDREFSCFSAFSTE